MPHLLRGFSTHLVASLALCTMSEVFACSCASQRSPDECGFGSVAVHVDIEAGATCNEWDSFSGAPGLDIKFWDATVREVIKDDSTGGLPITAGEPITVITTADSCQLFLEAGAHYIIYGSPDQLRSVPAPGPVQRRRVLELDAPVSSPAVPASGGGTDPTGPTDCICPLDYSPVCNLDTGKEYGNSCAAGCAGEDTSSLYIGSCDVAPPGGGLGGGSTPGNPGSDFEQCCASGEACCGFECVAVEQLAARLCPANSNCCGGDDKPEIPPPSPGIDDDYNACCESTEYCCGGGCVPSDEDPPRPCPAPWDSPGCCPGGKPPGSDDGRVPVEPGCVCPEIYAPVCHITWLAEFENTCTAKCEGAKDADLTEGTCDKWNPPDVGVSPPPNKCGEALLPPCSDTGCNAGLDVVKGACEPDNDCARVLQERNGKPRAHLAFSGCDSWVLQLNPTPADVMQAKVACGASITADAPSPGGADMTNVTLTDPSTDDTTTGSSAQAPGSSESTSTTAEGPGGDSGTPSSGTSSSETGDDSGSGENTTKSNVVAEPSAGFSDKLALARGCQLGGMLVALLLSVLL